VAGWDTIRSVAIQLLNPLWDASGGSEWRTISLYKLLAEHADVNVWTEYTPHPMIAAQVPVREMLKTQTFPKDGTFVFVGAYWEIGQWLRFAHPDRVILIYNVVDPDTLAFRIGQLEALSGKTVELVFASDLMAMHAGGRKGVVELSPIDLEAFSPAGLSPTPNPIPQRRTTLRDGARIVVGRHSRDEGFKHHPDDPKLYARLVEMGCQVRILGGTCLADRVSGFMEERVNGAGNDAPLPDSPTSPVTPKALIQLIPANSVPAPEFLRSLDIFFYRTDPKWIEPYGRVVVEAMATGLPCVLENRGGYAALIEHGANGFLFSSEEEALDQLRKLIADPPWRRRIGEAARESVVPIYGHARERILDFYLSPSPPPPVS